ncbi:MAG: isoleucine--tRNA ligase [Elusimicrobiota bacterium]
MNYAKTLNLPNTNFSMKANLSGKEPFIQKDWKKKEVYKKLLEKNKDNETFILHDGPPYANGHIHTGHALNRILKDIVLKYKAMNGYYTPFVPGWDCHGLPVEYELMKKMGSDAGKDKLKFRKRAADYAKNFVNIQRDEFRRLGLLGEWENPYLTLNKEYEEKIIECFKDIYLKDFIYRELKPVHWCYSCRTALAEAEVEYRDIESPSIYVRFEMTRKSAKEFKKDVYALAWTTTPWTLPANVALFFDPEIRYAFIENEDEILIVAREIYERNRDGLFENYSIAENEQGEEVIMAGEKLTMYNFKTPFGDRISQPISGHNLVDLEEGTGIIHIAPGHGEEDYIEISKYNSAQKTTDDRIDILSPVNSDGRFTDEADCREVTGEHVFDADGKIVELLNDRGLLFKKKDISHSYPHCWRCKSPVIFRATKQWFMKIDNNFREKLLDNVKSVNWYPEAAENRITAMLENRPDWCLSRQRMWGVPIPVFYCEECDNLLATKESFEKVQDMVAEEGTDAWFEKSAGEILGRGFTCENCGSENFRKESDILDVWFDSGVSSFAVLENRENLSWPADMYLEGSDQHRGWFQTSLIPSVAIQEQPPYRNVLTHGFVVDAEGKKMSKSVGNVISPQEVVKEFGADILRLWVASEDYFTDVKLSDEILKQITTYYRRIRNSIRFIMGNLQNFGPEDELEYEDLTSLDKFMLHKFHSTLTDVKKYYDDFLFYRATKEIHDFCNIWLSSFYFNILKDRLYVEADNSLKRRSSLTVLKIIGEELLKLIAPVLTHTAEEAWQKYLKEQGLKDQYPESILLCEIKEDIPDKWNNSELAKNWDSIIELRDIVLKEIEKAKEEEIVKDPLETSVTIKTDSKKLLKYFKNVPGDWKEYFIVSEVNFKKEDIDRGIKFLSGKISVEIKHAHGEKCERCWMITENVGESREHPGLCKRCVDIVK